jgi:polar amino acid transport system substrate-binding protein
MTALPSFSSLARPRSGALVGTRRASTRAGAQLVANLVCLALASASPVPDADARTLAQIRQVGAISICANPDALPYSSSRADSPGFQIEIARAIAQGLGVPLNVDWVVPRRRVREVNCDMLLDTADDPQLRTPERLRSIPYQRPSVALALRGDATQVRGLADLEPNQKIGVLVGSVASVVLGQRGLSISIYAFQDDMLDDLRKGELFGAAVSSATLSFYLKQHPEAGLRMVGVTDEEPRLGWTVSVGLRHADQALLDAVNRIVAALLADGTIASIYAKYGVEHTPP